MEPRRLAFVKDVLFRFNVFFGGGCCFPFAAEDLLVGREGEDCGDEGAGGDVAGPVALAVDEVEEA